MGPYAPGYYGKIIFFTFRAAVIAISQICYLVPFSKLRITNTWSYAVGSSIIAASVLFWFCQNDGITISFANLETGTVTGPILFAVTLPFLQAILSIGFTTFDPSGHSAEIPK